MTMYPERIKALVISDARSETDSNQTKYWREDSIELIKNSGLEDFADGFFETIFTSSSFKTHP